MCVTEAFLHLATRKRADSAPNSVFNWHFLTILAAGRVEDSASLEPVNNLVACAAYLGRENPGHEYQKPRKSNEMTHCHDMVCKTESLPKRDFTPDKVCCSRST